MSLMGHSRHCRGGQKLTFVRFTPLATVLGIGPKGRDVRRTALSTTPGRARLLFRINRLGLFGANRGIPMKYMLTWTERPQGSPMEYENAQKRILEVFTQWKAPGNFKIELFVIRVGDWGGYMLLDCDDPTAVHKFCSMLPAFVFEARPVIPIDDAVRVELESIAFRDGLKRK
jgi:muconolactone delta-isomerase